jgi:hypothetical protein
MINGIEFANTSRFISFTAICTFLSGLCQPVFGHDLNIVALGNMQAPGLPGGTVFTNGSFRRQSVNTAGQVVFKAVVTGNDEVLYFGFPGDLNLVAMEGDPAPGTPDGELCTFDMSNPGPSMVASADGKVAFAAKTLPPPTNQCAAQGRVGIWVWDDGVIELLALEGEQAADSDPGVIYSDIRPKFRHANQGTIFSATLFDDDTQTTLGRAILSGQPGAVEILAFIGDPAPGQPGKSYVGFGNQWPHNNTGQSTFWSWFNAPGSDQGIYRGNTTLLELLWKSGADASDFLLGYEFGFFAQQEPRGWGLNDDAHGCFSSRVVKTGDPTHDTVWRDLGASRAVVASTAFSDPGISPEFEFTAFSDCWISSTGRVLTRGIASSTMRGADRRGLWLTSATGGTPALDFITSASDTLVHGGEEYLVSLQEPEEPHINRLGSVVFEVFVSHMGGPSVRSIWLSNGAWERLVAIAGQNVTLDNQQQTTLGAFVDLGIGENGSGNEDGNPSAVSDDDEVVFNTTITGNIDAILITPGRSSDHFFKDGYENL